jgi:ubiquinone/menaquinone biosynthesis C-methylase UbiE
MARLSSRPQDGAHGNVDAATVAGFGAEWSRFDQSDLADDERAEIFGQYFAVFPWDALPAGAAGFDLGCGSGRWAAVVAPRVGTLHCVDASPEALDVARRNLAGHANCTFHVASVDALPFADASMDFGYSLGVLHHVPDTQAAIAAAARPLRPGAPLLLYLYYAFDNRPSWYRAVWRASDVLRRAISRSPVAVKTAVTSVIAALVYLPLARAAKLLDRAGLDVERVPLSFYRDRSFYTMRTDAFDRFATRLEQRFTAREIEAMMRAAGLTDVTISPGAPHWCAVGRRALASVTRASPGAAAGGPGGAADST